MTLGDGKQGISEENHLSCDPLLCDGSAGVAGWKQVRGMNSRSDSVPKETWTALPGEADRF